MLGRGTLPAQFPGARDRSDPPEEPGIPQEPDPSPIEPMKISAIMACYNSEATIRRAIGSFLDQTHADRELVVVDGDSRDGTCAVVEGFDSPLIRLASEPDRGIYDAINKGIGRAQGQIIGILHSNDRLAHPGVLARVAETFAADDLDAAYADVTFFAPEAPDRVTRRYDSSRFAPAALAQGLMPAHTSLFLHRRVFETFGLYRADYRIAGDFEFVARIFKDGRLRARYLPEVWVHMLAGGASTAGLGAKVTLNREVRRACRENGIATSYPRLLSKYPRKILELIRH